MKRLALGAAAVVCVALATALFLLAVDIGRWNDAMAADDVRYRAEPESTDLWQPDTVLPFGAAKRLLGTGDDLAFREALRALRLGRLDLGITSDPVLALSRGEARARLQQVATEDDDRVRRSRATNLVGVIAFASSLTEARDQAAFVQDAAAAFQTAIELDPEQPRGEGKPRARAPARAGAPADGGRRRPEPVARRLGREGRGRGRPGLGLLRARVRPHLPVAEGCADRARSRPPARCARARRAAGQPPPSRPLRSRARRAGAWPCRRSPPRP